MKVVLFLVLTVSLHGVRSSSSSDITDEELYKIIDLATTGQKFEGQPEIYYAHPSPHLPTSVITGSPAGVGGNLVKALYKQNSKSHRHRSPHSHHHRHHSKGIGSLIYHSVPSLQAASAYSNNILHYASSSSNLRAATTTPAVAATTASVPTTQNKSGIEILGSIELPSKYAQFVKGPGGHYAQVAGKTNTEDVNQVAQESRISASPAIQALNGLPSYSPKYSSPISSGFLPQVQSQQLINPLNQVYSVRSPLFSPGFPAAPSASSVSAAGSQPAVRSQLSQVFAQPPSQLIHPAYMTSALPNSHQSAHLKAVQDALSKAASLASEGKSPAVKEPGKTVEFYPTQHVQQQLVPQQQQSIQYLSPASASPAQQPQHLSHFHTVQPALLPQLQRLPQQVSLPQVPSRHVDALSQLRAFQQQQQPALVPQPTTLPQTQLLPQQQQRQALLQHVQPLQQQELLPQIQAQRQQQAPLLQQIQLVQQQRQQQILPQFQPAPQQQPLYHQQFQQLRPQPSAVPQILQQQTQQGATSQQTRATSQHPSQLLPLAPHVAAAQVHALSQHPAFHHYAQLQHQAVPAQVFHPLPPQAPLLPSENPHQQVILSQISALQREGLLRKPQKSTDIIEEQLLTQEIQTASEIPAVVESSSTDQQSSSEELQEKSAQQPTQQPPALNPDQMADLLQRNQYPGTHMMYQNQQQQQVQQLMQHQAQRQQVQLQAQEQQIQQQAQQQQIQQQAQQQQIQQQAQQQQIQQQAQQHMQQQAQQQMQQQVQQQMQQQAQQQQQVQQEQQIQLQAQHEQQMQVQAQQEQQMQQQVQQRKSRKQAKQRKMQQQQSEQQVQQQQQSEQQVQQQQSEQQVQQQQQLEQQVQQQQLEQQAQQQQFHQQAQQQQALQQAQQQVLQQAQQQQVLQQVQQQLLQQAQQQQLQPQQHDPAVPLSPKIYTVRFQIPRNGGPITHHVSEENSPEQSDTIVLNSAAPTGSPEEADFNNQIPSVNEILTMLMKDGSIQTAPINPSAGIPSTLEEENGTESSESAESASEKPLLVSQPNGMVLTSDTITSSEEALLEQIQQPQPEVRITEDENGERLVSLKTTRILTTPMALIASPTASSNNAGGSSSSAESIVTTRVVARFKRPRNKTGVRRRKVMKNSGTSRPLILA